MTAETTRGKVHNHGPTEGRGLDCPERRTDAGLVGACLTERRCPTCGAEGGQSCTTPTGVRLDRRHPARDRAADRTTSTKGTSR